MSTKITDLDEQTAGTLHDDDLFVDVDVSDTTMAPSGTDKKSKWSSIKSTLKTYFDTLYASITMNTARLRGRTTAGSGAVEEISVAGSLSLAAGVLTGTAKVVQVVQATKTDTATVTGAAFGSVFSGTITPTTNTSKIIVLVMLSLGQATGQFVFVRLVRSAATLIQGDAASNRTRVTTASSINQAGGLQGVPVIYMDSPASVAAQTYEIEIASHSTGAVYLNRTGTDTDTAGFARGSSVMLLIEVLA